MRVPSCPVLGALHSWVSVASLVSLSALALGCGGGRETPTRDGADAAPGGPDGAPPLADSGPTVLPVATMYVHTADMLYSVDDQSFDLKVIGPFGVSEEDSMTDLAVTAGGAIYGISSEKVFSIDAETGDATELSTFDGGYNVGMSFLDTGELWVADKQEGEIFEVDPESGDVNTIGTYGMNFVTAGDIVAVGDGTVYAIVQDTDGTEGDSNILVTVNTSTGEVDDIIGEIGFSNVFGAAYANGKVYAFTDIGQIIEINRTTAEGALKRTYDAEQFPFWGAGVSAAVPVD